MNDYGKVEREHEEYGVGPGENLKVFEKTWGHRLLMGLSVCMFVAGLVLAIYCGVRLHSIQEVLTQNIAYSYAYAFYLAGLVIGVAIIPPSILGVFVATHPKAALAAVVAAVLALVIIIVFVAYSASIGGQAFSIALYAVLFAIVPVVYLACSLKIKRSQ